MKEAVLIGRFGSSGWVRGLYTDGYSALLWETNDDGTYARARQMMLVGSRHVMNLNASYSGLQAEFGNTSNPSRPTEIRENLTPPRPPCIILTRRKKK